jgi:hypothetical protein
MAKKYHVVFKRIDEETIFGEEMSREDIYRIRKDKSVIIIKISEIN